MDLQDALLIVREKYKAEVRGVTTGIEAEGYAAACQDYPLVMAMARHLFAMELETDRRRE